MIMNILQVSTLFFLSYANSAGGVMKLLLVEDGAAQEFRVKGGTQNISEKLADIIGRENIKLEVIKSQKYFLR